MKTIEINIEEIRESAAKWKEKVVKNGAEFDGKSVQYSGRVNGVLPCENPKILLATNEYLRRFERGESA